MAGNPFLSSAVPEAIGSPPSPGHAKSKKAAARIGAGKLKLTTGAALQAGTNDPVDVPIRFAIGMQVRHPRYGLGTVVDVSGMTLRRTVTVEFDKDNRRESFVEAKCPLQRVGFR
jgi:hypothetical protein